MRISFVFLGVLALAAAGCRKDTPPPPPTSGGSTGGTGGTGGTGSGAGGPKPPTGWLVGNGSTLAHVGVDGSLAFANAPVVNEQLNNIACRYQGEAWVVGNGGSLLYTNDAG